MLVDWFLEQVEFIFVIVWGIEEISCVWIFFYFWVIIMYGVVIFMFEGKFDEEWKVYMFGQLVFYQEKLILMQCLIIEMMDVKGINVWVRLNFEYGEMVVYMVMKYCDSICFDEFNVIVDEIEMVFLIEGFYIYCNSNNVVWFFILVEKGLVVSWLFEKFWVE